MESVARGEADKKVPESIQSTAALSRAEGGAPYGIRFSARLWSRGLGLRPLFARGAHSAAP